MCTDTQTQINAELVTVNQFLMQLQLSKNDKKILSELIV